MKSGHLKHIISQNLDGLHVKSGIPLDKISELHGNTNLEICSKCSTKYYQDFNVIVAGSKNHKTGRKCDSCQSDLKDSIINFGESLNTEICTQGFDQAHEADLMLSLGSSLRVAPANAMAAIPPLKGGKLVICNLQKTGMDHEAALMIHCKIDDLLVRLMKKLELQIPKF